MLALARCSCDEGQSIYRATVELELTAVLESPCGGAVATARLPDDAEGAFTVGLRPAVAQTFQLRSLGAVSVTIASAELSAPSDDIAVALERDGAPVALPAVIPSEGPEAPGAQLRVTYTPIDDRVEELDLVIRSDDPERPEIRIGLVAGPGLLKVSPPEVDFGSVAIGDSKTEEVVIENAGRGTVALDALRIVSTSAELCAAEASDVPTGARCTRTPICPVLAGGQSLTVHVAYAPEDGGDDTGTLVIVANAGEGAGNVEVPLRGRGAGAALCTCIVDGGRCTPASTIDFGTVAAGTARSIDVRLQSCGTDAVGLVKAELEIDPSSPYFTDATFTIETPFQGALLDPGQSVDGTLQYRPGDTAAHTGGLRIEQSSPPRTFWVPLAGNTVGCDLEVLPNAVDFGVVPGGTVGMRNVLVSNSGARSCQVTAITDPSDGFAIEGKPALPLVIDSGNTLPITIAFAAPADIASTMHRSSFEISALADGVTEVAPVSLAAIAGGPAGCEVEVRPSGNTPFGDGMLSFGVLPTGQMRTRSVRIRNRGGDDCTLVRYQAVYDFPFGNPLFEAVPQALPSVIHPGEETTVDVTYTSEGSVGPNTLPIFNRLEITLSGPGLTKPDWEISLEAGEPLEPAIEVTPRELDFGIVTWDNPQPPDNRSSCGSRVRSLSIYSTGTDDLAISAVEETPDSDSLFQITEVRQNQSLLSAPYRNLLLTPGESLSVSLRFFPTRASPSDHVGTLLISNAVAPGVIAVPLDGEGRNNAVQTDVFNQTSGNMVDILWVVDDSGSMEEEQALLAQNFATFIGFADSLGIDYQTAVTTTEVNNLDSAGKIWACNGFDKIIRSTDPNRVPAFECAVAVSNPPNGNLPPNEGSSGEKEAGLGAAKLALSTPLVDHENAGFLRFDASLAVIIVSDEEDQSDGPVESYATFFRNIKGDENLVSVSAIAGDVPNGCPTADAGARYQMAALSLNGQFESICAQSWTNMLMNIGFDAFTRRTSWPLSREAEPGTITVRVGGATVPQGATDGWTYDAASNSVAFHGNGVPPDGASIEITYQVVCLP